VLHSPRGAGEVKGRSEAECISALDRQLGWDDRKQAQVFFTRMAIGSGVGLSKGFVLAVRRVETRGFGLRLFR